MCQGKGNRVGHDEQEEYRKPGGTEEQGGFGESLPAPCDWSEGLRRCVTGARAQNSFVGDFLTLAGWTLQKESGGGTSSL